MVDFVGWLYCASYSLLLIVYTTVIAYLIKTLELVKDFYKQQYKHILVQFFFFEMAFIVKILFEILL